MDPHCEGLRRSGTFKHPDPHVSWLNGFLRVPKILINIVESNTKVSILGGVSLSFLSLVQRKSKRTSPFSPYFCIFCTFCPFFTSCTFWITVYLLLCSRTKNEGNDLAKEHLRAKVLGSLASLTWLIFCMISFSGNVKVF